MSIAHKTSHHTHSRNEFGQGLEPDENIFDSKII